MIPPFLWRDFYFGLPPLSNDFGSGSMALKAYREGVDEAPE
jgi:hypothetical protein